MRTLNVEDYIAAGEEHDRKTKEWYEAKQSGSRAKQAKTTLGYDKVGDRKIHEILGVKANATPEQVKKAYRDQSRKLHPDVNRGRDTTEDQKTLNEAYSRYMKNIRGKNDSLADQLLREAFRTDSADMSSYWRIVDLSLEWGVPIDFWGVA